MFDTVRSVLHPSLTSPGAPGRARLHDATSTTTVLEDLPRLLGGWVMGEDLVAKDGSATGSYRMRADLTGLAPSWPIGGTQLRTHQQAQHSVSHSAGKGRGGTFGAGPAAGFGVLGGAAAVRGTVMPTAGVRKARFTMAEQTVSSRQGAEVRGDKVLYFGRVRFRVEGTGPLSPAMRVRAGTRTAHHSMDVWVALRADEAQALGLALPDGVTAGPMVAVPAGADAGKKRAGDTAVSGQAAEAEGEGGSSRAGQDTERHLPFGAMGSSVTISQLDTAPLLSGIERLFTADPRLAGYLPSFGPGPRRRRAVRRPRSSAATTASSSPYCRRPTCGSTRTSCSPPGSACGCGARAGGTRTTCRFASSGRSARRDIWETPRTGWCAVTPVSPATPRAGAPVRARSAASRSASSGSSPGCCPPRCVANGPGTAPGATRRARRRAPTC
ncbi:hypothetical protein ACFQ51_47600 [Streptomyces kaempferi]